VLDLKLIRSDAARVRAGLESRSGRYLPAFEQLQIESSKHLDLLKRVEGLRADQNKLSAEIGLAKKSGQSSDELRANADSLKKAMADLEVQLKSVQHEMDQMLLSIPNLPHESVPGGKTPEENKELRRSGEPRAFAFKPKDHQALGEALGILDLETAGRMSGSRFSILKGRGARLERAIVQFMLDLHTREHGYLEISPPLLVSSETLTGTGQLPKFEEDQYKTAPDGLYLIPTAEVPLTNLHRGEILEESRLPTQYAAATPCFRREAGSYGKDTRGLIRQHQFQKVELVWLAKPEQSFELLEKLTRHAEAVLERLELPHRVIELCTGDLGFSAAKTYDLEVWMPGEARWREVSSCSNCTDFQARRMSTRFKRAQGKPELVHTLNGSGVAAGRVFAAVLENGQQIDGSIAIPEALRSYTGFDRIP
jgi:seryl-tRNA synthetase